MSKPLLRNVWQISRMDAGEPNWKGTVAVLAHNVGRLAVAIFDLADALREGQK